jgi:MFS superfamily sulfate permease-like transporter
MSRHCGARPEQGIYTAIVAAVMTSLFGGTRVQISGPTGAFVAVLAIITAQHGIAGLQIATLRTTTLVLRLGNVPFVDATGIFALEEILADFKRNGAAVPLTEVRPNVLYKLERGGLIDLIGKENVFESLSEALACAEQSGTAARYL